MEVRATDEVRRLEFGTVEKLRIVPPDKAFYFYRGVGDPLHKIANSLPEFADIAKNIDVDSIGFHVERGDFERWFRLLGEHSLANEVDGLRGKNISPQELRTELSLMVGSRVNQLRHRAALDRPEPQDERIARRRPRLDSYD